MKVEEQAMVSTIEFRNYEISQLSDAVSVFLIYFKLGFGGNFFLQQLPVVVRTRTTRYRHGWIDEYDRDCFKDDEDDGDLSSDIYSTINKTS